MRRFLELPPIVYAGWCAAQAGHWLVFWFFLISAFAVALWDPDEIDAREEM